jgi:hypothetical protein
MAVTQNLLQARIVGSLSVTFFNQLDAYLEPSVPASKKFRINYNTNEIEIE